MRIVRFDEEVSRPITAFGSSFSLAELTEPFGRLRASVLYLAPGGRIGAHDAVGPQLLAVVAGSGWVAGSERRRDLRPGYGALFEAGEHHEAGTESGMTALCLEGEFEVSAFMVTTEIVVADHDPEWAGWFERLVEHLWPVVAEVALRIEHVGSTSVPGLAAKPVIDLDIVVASRQLVDPAIERLAAAGFAWRGDLGVVGRQAFSSPPGLGLPAHHLYLVVENSKAHIDHWLLRDVLRAEPEARDRYGALKRANVELADGDIDVYVAAKASFVADLLTRARAERGLPEAEYWVPEAGPER